MRLVSAGTGLLGLGLAAAGGAVGYAAERYALRRVRGRPDPEAREPFGRLPGRHRVVTTDDGVPLHVEEVGEPDAPLTVVLCHGYALESACWHFQRRDLPGLLTGRVGGGPDAGVRVVVWDQRSHGRSGRATPESCTIDQLGRDLTRVLAATALTGPVVLVGHSMGGMTIMALADQCPELFDGRRVVGVGLVSTSAGALAEVTFGLPAFLTGVKNRALPWLAQGTVDNPRLVDRTRRLGSDVAYLLTLQYGFGSRDASPSVVAFVERMVAQTPSDVIAAFYPTFTSHDKLAALPVLAGVEVLVVAGESDVVTPADHSRAIAEAAPGARLVVLPDSGHNVMLERHREVTAELADLVLRAVARSGGAGRG